jgi:hypothetical protein
VADLATLGFTIDPGGQVDKAAASLGKFAGAARAAQGAAGSLGGTFAGAAKSADEQARAVGSARDALGRFAAGAGAAKAANDSLNRSFATAHIDAYRQRLEGLRATYNAQFAAIQQYRAAVSGIRAAHEAGALSAREMARAIAIERREALASIAAYKQRGAAAMQMAQQVRAANAAAAGNAGMGPQGFATANLAAQFQDIGVTAAMGMNPLQIALQQGTQMAMIFQATGQSLGKTLAGAFASVLSPLTLVVIALTAGAAALIQWVDWTNVGKTALNTLAGLLRDFSTEITIAGAALALAFSPAILGAVAQLTAGILLLGKAIAVLALTNPFGLIITGVGLAAAAIYTFRDDWRAIFAEIVSIAKDVGNAIVGVYVFAYKAVIAMWENLPRALGDLAYQAVNNMIAAFNDLANNLPDFAKDRLGIARSFESYMEDANEVGREMAELIERQRAAREIGNDMDAGMLDQRIAEARAERLRLQQAAAEARHAGASAGLISPRENPFAGAASGLGDALTRAHDESFGPDYIGPALDVVAGAAGAAADAISRYATTLGESDAAAKKAKKALEDIAEAYANIKQGARDATAEARLEIALLEATAEQAAKARIEFQLLNQARDAGVTMDTKVRRELAGLAAGQAAAETALTRETFLRDMGRDEAEHIAQQEMERAAIGKTKEEADRLRYSFELLAQARRENINLSPEEIAGLNAAAAAMAKADAATAARQAAFERYKSVITETREAARSFAGDFIAGIRAGEGAVKSLLNALNNLLTRLTDKLLDSIFNQLFPTPGATPAPAGGGGIFGGLFSAIGSLFGGGAAAAPAVAAAAAPAAAEAAAAAAAPAVAAAAVAAVAGTPGTGTPSGFALPGSTISGGAGSNTLLGSAARDAVTATATGAHGQRLAPISLANGRSVLVNADYAPNFQGLVQDLEARGYTINSLGGYVNRNVAGTNKLSNHAFGNAIDINPAQNPHLKDGRLVTDIPDASALAEKWGLGWGGNWRSSKDAMHFEVPAGGRETALAAQGATASMNKVAGAADKAAEATTKMAESGTKAAETLGQVAAPAAAAGGAPSAGGGGPSFAGLGQFANSGGPWAAASPAGFIDLGAGTDAGVGRLIPGVMNAGNTLTSGLGGAFQGIVAKVGEIGGNFAGGFGNVLQSIVGAISGGGGAAGGGGGGIFGSLFGGIGKAIGGIFGGGFSAAATGLAAAGGGLFASGAAFTGGGVVQHPSLFNIGGMAESGPESIMPLASRGGKLGVINHGGSGGATVVNVYNTFSEAGWDTHIERVSRPVAQAEAQRGDRRVAGMIQPSVDKRLDDHRFRGAPRSPSLLGAV